MSLSVTAGHPHNFWNAHNSTALDIEITLRPAGSMLPFFKTYCGLAQDVGTLDSVNPLQMLVLFVAGALTWLIFHVQSGWSSSMHWSLS